VCDENSSINRAVCQQMSSTKINIVETYPIPKSLLKLFSLNHSSNKNRKIHAGCERSNFPKSRSDLWIITTAIRIRRRAIVWSRREANARKPIVSSYALPENTNVPQHIETSGFSQYRITYSLPVIGLRIR
jgi:hypothetical protein